RLKIRSRRSISWRTRRIVRRANAASGCHKVISDSAPSTSPFQLCNRGFGALARTAAIIGGRPATAATMRRRRRRVRRPVGSGQPSIFASGIVHPDIERLDEPGGAHQRQAPRVVVVLDLAIEALKALARDDPAARLDRADRTRVFAEVAGVAALGTPLEQVEQVQAIEECEQATQWTEEAAVRPLRE